MFIEILLGYKKKEREGRRRRGSWEGFFEKRGGANDFYYATLENEKEGEGRKENPIKIYEHEGWLKEIHFFFPFTHIYIYLRQRKFFIQRKIVIS